jgi:hypothetical protein
MSETGLTVPDMNEPLSRYNVTVTVRCDGVYLPDPAAFAAAADQAAWSRSASIVSAYLADKIISVVTVTAPDQYAAAAVARTIISGALKHQAPSPSLSADDRAVGAENLCHQAIFVDDATHSVMPPDPEMIQVGDAIWQRPQWRGLVRGAMRPVGIVEVLVLAQHHLSR